MPEGNHRLSHSQLSVMQTLSNYSRIVIIFWGISASIALMFIFMESVHLDLNSKVKLSFKPINFRNFMPPVGFFTNHDSDNHLDDSIAESLKQNETKDSDKKPEMVTFLGYSIQLIANLPNFCFNSSESSMNSLVFVTSRSDSQAKRIEIRNSWSKHLKENLNFSTIFILGINYEKKEPSVQDLLKEQQQYNDVVIFDFKDSYVNLTLKSGLAFYWVSKYCRSARISIKADDDTVVLPNGVREFLKSVDLKKNQIFGNVFAGAGPIRNKQSKWYISEEVYPKPRYPNLVSGHGYILTGYNTSGELFQHAQNYSGNYIYLEDVFWTGIMAEESHIPRNNQFQNRFCTSFADVNKVCERNAITVHYVSEVKKYFEEYLATCKLA